MSDTSMTQETQLATELFDLNLHELEKLSLNAMKSAFAPFDKRLKIIFDTIKPGFARIRAGLNS
jgi:adenosine deaminase